jgi:hypothetical protein
MEVVETDGKEIPGPEAFCTTFSVALLFCHQHCRTENSHSLRSRSKKPTIDVYRRDRWFGEDIPARF